MKMHKIECPNCHAQLDPIEGLDTFWCPYCRGKVIVDEMSDKYYDTKVRFGEMEHEERMKDKEFEHEKFKLSMTDLENKRAEKRQYFGLLLIPVFVLVFIVLWNVFLKSIF